MKRISIIISFFVLVGIFASCENEVATKKITEEFSGTWKFLPGAGTDGLWINSDYDDSSWQEVTSEKLLSDQNVRTEYGFGRYRKTIRFSDSLRYAIDKEGGLILHLGKSAACDEVYFNGLLVGKTGEFPPDYMGTFDGERNYVVTENINLTGDNLIAVKFNEGWTTGGFIGGARLKISSAETDDKLIFKVDVHDEDYVFMSPDPVRITINVENKNKQSVKGILAVNITTDDFRPVKSESTTVVINGKGNISETFVFDDPSPGFYRYAAEFKRNSKTVYDKRFNVGYEPEKIDSPIDSKPDFDEFWENNLKELAKVAPQYKLTLLPESSTFDYDMYLVEMRSFGNELIRGYYAKPKPEGKHPVIVDYMGYGSTPYMPDRTWDGFAKFILSIRGQALNLPENRFGTWMTYGLDDKNNYYYRGAFLDVIRALDFVSGRPEIDGDKIAVRGGSQGGALSFAAAALDDRVKVAAPYVPFLSDYVNYFKIVPWPKSGFESYLKDNPDTDWNAVYDVLSYFDIKNLAPRIKCPLIMGTGMQDEVCPPRINFAAYNQVKSEKYRMVFARFGHSVGKDYYEASMKLIREKLGIE